MKNVFFAWLSLVMGTLCSPKVFGQQQELEQLSLDLEKLAQFKQILADLKNGYVVLSKGYGNIKNISEGNFKLHQAFLDGLLQVSPAIRNYKRVGDIIHYQLMLVRENRIYCKRFSNDPNLTSTEMSYIKRTYNNIIQESIKNLEELTGILTDNNLRMSDDERLKSIDRIFFQMQDKLMFLKDFNNNTTVLQIQRAREKNDVFSLKNLYGLIK